MAVKQLLVRLILIFFFFSSIPIFVLAQASVSSFELEEVVVTVRKREENLQETLVAASVFIADDMEARHISSTNQLTAIAPNLSFTVNMIDRSVPDSEQKIKKIVNYLYDHFSK